MINMTPPPLLICPPGDKRNVSELELFVWASRNQALLFKLENATPEGNNNGIIKQLMIKAGISKPTPEAPIEDETKESTAAKGNTAV